MKVGDLWKYYKDPQTNGFAVITRVDIAKNCFNVMWLSANGFTVNESTSTDYPIIYVLSGKSGWSKLS